MLKCDNSVQFTFYFILQGTVCIFFQYSLRFVSPFFLEKDYDFAATVDTKVQWKLMLIESAAFS